MSDKKYDFPIIVLSILMLAGGLIMALGAMNLPFLATDQIHGPARIILGGFAVLAVGFGAGLCRAGLTNRMDRWSSRFFMVGASGFATAFVTILINHPATQAAFGL